MRSSCEASARNRRRRSSLASRCANACSRRSSIAFSASPSRPTSVRVVAGLTRRESSPAAISPAVTSMRSSGRRPRRTTKKAVTAEREQHADDHEPLDEQQPVERLLDFAQRHRDDRDPPRPPGRDRRRRDSAAPMEPTEPTVNGLPTGTLRRELRRRGAALAVADQHVSEHLARRRSALTVGPRRQVGVRPAARQARAARPPAAARRPVPPRAARRPAVRRSRRCRARATPPGRLRAPAGRRARAGRSAARQ